MSRVPLALAFAGVLALSGCAVPSVTDSTHKSTAPPLGATATSTSTYDADDERAASPHEFVVYRTENQSKPDRLSTNATSRFGNLGRER
jgi:hypothetical protein